MKYSKLESLRGIAAVMVMLFHSEFRVFESQSLLIANSYLFVDFFFVLSGFVMSFAYTDRISEGMPVSTFIRIRLARLYPLHLVILTLWIPYVLLKQYLYTSGFGGSNEFENNNLYSLLTNVLLIHSMGIHDSLSWNNPSWSISVEFFTYLVFFLFIRVLGKSNSLLAPILISVCGYWWLLSLGRPNFDITFDFGFVRCIAGFFLGVTMFRLIHFFDGDRAAPKFIEYQEISVVVLVILCVSHSAKDPIFLIFSFLNFAYAIYLFSYSSQGWIAGILESRLFRKMGEWSYSIYMIHALVLSLMSNIVEYGLGIDLDSGLGLFAVLANILQILFVVFVSRFLFIYVEKRYQRKLSQPSIKNR